LSCTENFLQSIGYLCEGPNIILRKRNPPWLIHLQLFYVFLLNLVFEEDVLLKDKALEEDVLLEDELAKESSES